MKLFRRGQDDEQNKSNRIGFFILLLPLLLGVIFCASQLGLIWSVNDRLTRDVNTENEADYQEWEREVVIPIDPRLNDVLAGEPTRTPGPRTPQNTPVAVAADNSPTISSDSPEIQTEQAELIEINETNTEQAATEIAAAALTATAALSTDTRTPTGTLTRTQTITRTVTGTVSTTPTVTGTTSRTATVTGTISITPTITGTVSPTVTDTRTSTSFPSLTSTTIPPTATNTNVPPLPTATNTNVPPPPPTNTNVPPPPPTATNTNVPPPPPTATNTNVPPPPTATNTNIPPSPTPTNTPVPPTATFTLTPTEPGGGPIFTSTPVSPTATFTPTNTPNTTADLAITIGADRTDPAEGTPVTFTIQVTNNGPADTTGVQVSVLFPPEFTFVVAIPGQGTYSSGTGVWNIGALMNGSSVTLQVTTTVNNGTIGSSLSVSTLISASAVPDSNITNNSASVGINPVAVSGTLDLIVSHSGPTLIDVNQELSYSISVRNIGPSVATNVSVIHGFSPTIVYQSVSGAGSFDTGTGIWTVGTLMPGATASMTFSIRPDISYSGQQITSTATLSGVDQADTNGSNNTASILIQVATATPVPPTPTPTNVQGRQGLLMDLTVNDSSPPENSLITYTLTLSNVDTANYTGVQVLDILPSGVSFVSASPGVGTYDSSTGIWNVASVTSGSSVSMTITARVDLGTAGSTITNNASVISSAPSPVGTNGDDSVSIVPVAVGITSDIAVQLEVVNQQPVYFLGELVTYRMTLTNNGPDTASSIRATLNFPAFTSDTHWGAGSYNTGNGVWDVSLLLPGASVTHNHRFIVPGGLEGTTQGATFSLTALNQSDPVSGNNNSSVNVVIAGTDLGITKTANNTSPNEGQTVVFTITVTNHGPQNASSVAVTDNLPIGLTYNSHTTSAGTYDTGTGVWSVGPLSSGANATLTITTQVNAGTVGGVITNTASITSFPIPDTNTVNNSASASLAIQVPDVDLALSKSVNNATPLEGTAVAFTITVTNTGTASSAGIVVNDALPAGLSYASHTVSQGTYDSGSGNWNVGTIGAGAQATLTLSANIGAGTGGTTITNTANITATSVNDPNPANNSASVNVNPVTPTADLEFITFSVSNPNPNEGNDVTITIEITNNGPQPATNVVLGAASGNGGLVLNSFTATHGSYGPGTDTWTIPNLNSGITATLQLFSTVGPGTTGTSITHTREITGSDVVDPDSTPGNGAPAEDDINTFTINVN